jgi:streptogramin lyase
VAISIREMWITPGPQPNGLQAAPDGLWVMDQEDNRVYQLAYKDGSVLQASPPTPARHSSGIVIDPAGGVWVASTFTYEVIKIDMSTGDALARWVTPGGPKGGAHGLEWRDDELWLNVPVTREIYRMDPKDGRILGAIPAPGVRPHGMAWEDGKLWCVDTTDKAIYKLDPTSGKILDKIDCREPEPHGMTIHSGQMWLCDAKTRQVFVLDR